jgi:hypothetical protein
VRTGEAFNVYSQHLGGIGFGVPILQLVVRAEKVRREAERRLAALGATS